jgi:hypothetical protein
MLFIVTSVRMIQTHGGWTWWVLAVPIGLLLIFGPILIGQRMARRKK